MNAPTIKAIQNLGAFEKSTLVHQAQYCVTGASCPSPNSSATVAEVPEQVKKTQMINFILIMQANPWQLPRD